MSDQYVGELRIFAFNFPPRGWMLCNGQLLAIQQYQALFSILGTTYGGNGTTTFALPNLQGQVPIHTGGQIGAVLGQTGGEVNHTLLLNELPMHNHQVITGATPTSNSPANCFPAKQLAKLYGPASPVAAMKPAEVGLTGGNQPHINMAPYLTINICIAIVGIFPSRN